MSVSEVERDPAVLAAQVYLGASDGSTEGYGLGLIDGVGGVRMLAGYRYVDHGDPIGVVKYTEVSAHRVIADNLPSGTEDLARTVLDMLGSFYRGEEGAALE